MKLSACLCTFRREKGAPIESGIAVTTEHGSSEVVAVIPKDGTTRVDVIGEVWDIRLDWTHSIDGRVWNLTMKEALLDAAPIQDELEKEIVALEEEHDREFCDIPDAASSLKKLKHILPEDVDICCRLSGDSWRVFITTYLAGDAKTEFQYTGRSRYDAMHNAARGLSTTLATLGALAMREPYER